MLLVVGKLKGKELVGEEYRKDVLGWIEGEAGGRKKE